MKKLLESKTIENFFLAATCATVFTMSLCYWILELTYKYNHNMDSVVDINWVAGAGLIISVYYLFKKKRIEFDSTLCFLLQLTLLMGVIDYHRGEFLKVCYAWFIPTSYIIGKLVVSYDEDDVFVYRNKRIENRTYLLFFSLVVGMFLLAFSDFLPNWRSGWAFGTENWSSVWAENTTARTTFVLGFVPMIGTFCIVFFISKRKKLLSLLLIITNVLIQYFAFKTEAREPICMFIITMVIGLTMTIVDRWKQIGARKKVKALFIVCVLVLVIVVFFQLDIFGLKTAYRNSFFSDGGGIIKNQRIILNSWAIDNIIMFPTEDITNYKLYPGHNMTLNLGAVYDLTTMLLVLIVKILYSIEALKMFINKRIGMIKYVLIPTFINLNIYYVLEPNAAYAKEYWMASLVVSGMIAGWNELEKKNHYY